MRALGLLLLAGCAAHRAPPAKAATATATPKPTATATATATPRELPCDAALCVGDERFSTEDLDVWRNLWRVDDVREPARTLLARARECAARGVAVSDDELVEYLRAGGPLGEFGAPAPFTTDRYAVYVPRLGLTYARYEALRRREAIVARCGTPPLWPGWPRARKPVSD